MPSLRKVRPVRQNIMHTSSKQTSKLISYWLRHHPKEAGIQVDAFGWAPIDQILHALEVRNIKVSLQDLIELNSSSDKVRWEIDTHSGKLRATHGHSFHVILEDKVKLPPGELYHCTSVQYVMEIAEKGLKSMNRQFVHLSETIEMAKNVGIRHGKPIIIEIETASLVKAGWKFYQSSDTIWLTADIPAAYLCFRPWHPIDTSMDFFIKELKREIGNRHSHFLYPHLNNLLAVWQSSASASVLFKDQETGKCYAIHLTYTKMDQEVNEWPRIKTYKTMQDWIAEGLWYDQQCFYDFT